MLTITVWTLPEWTLYTTIAGADHVEHRVNGINVYNKTHLLASFGPGYAWAIETVVSPAIPSPPPPERKDIP